MVKAIEDFIMSAEFLPPSFHLLPKLLLLLDDMETNADSLAELIRVDPGLTADILRVCNSVAFAARTRAETVQEAVLRLGFREVHRIVMTVIASPALKAGQETYGRNETDLWRHSLAAAVSSQQIVTGGEADLAFTAALLHDIGKTLLAAAVPDDFLRAAFESAEKNQPQYQAERSILGTDHADVGSRLLRRWGFPPNLCAAVEFHHEPASTREHVRLASSVYLANVLAYRVDGPLALPEYVLFPEARALREWGLTQPALTPLAEEARREFGKLRERFR